MRYASILLCAALLLCGRQAAAQSHDVCRPIDNVSASDIMQRVRGTLGYASLGDRVLHFKAGESVQQSFQSERTYPPFFDLVRMTEVWYAPSTGVERTAAEAVYPGYGPFQSPAILQDARGAFLVRDTTMMPAPAGMGSGVVFRLNAWAVAAEWSDEPDLRVHEECLYRDFWRIVVETPARPLERLFVDAKTGFPVKLDVIEPHYLWGQVHVEYQYALWERFDGVHFPRAAFRVVDGAVDLSRTVAAVDFLAPADAPALSLPSERPPAGSDTPRFLQPLPPDTVAVADDVYLLRNVGYTEAFALAGDTIYVFDATQGEERARQDHDWIRRLIPGDHPVAVVVTDLAWPHVAGVRYWVAQGATIISHAMSEAFLRRVVERAWTLEPDLLEQQRRPMTFIGLEGSRTFGAGEVRITPIDGIGSEGALIAYLPESRFLWAGDFIQTLGEPSSYAAEVRTAVHRAGFDPIRVAAQHLPLSEWSRVEELHEGL